MTRSVPQPTVAAGLASLEEIHIEVLQRIALFKSSKEIARELNISPDTVDQRVKRIILLLGVRTRAEAARAFVEQHGHPSASKAVYPDLVYPSSDMANPGITGDPVGSSGEMDPAEEPKASIAAEPQTAFIRDVCRSGSRQGLVSILMETSRVNSLGPVASVGAVVGIVLVIMAMLAVLVILAEGLSRIF